MSPVRNAICARLFYPQIAWRDGIEPLLAPTPARCSAISGVPARRSQASRLGDLRRPVVASVVDAGKQSSKFCYWECCWTIVVNPMMLLLPFLMIHDCRVFCHRIYCGVFMYCWFGTYESVSKERQKFLQRLRLSQLKLKNSFPQASD